MGNAFAAPAEPEPTSGQTKLGYRDVTEELTDVPCSVQGSLPPYVKGQMFRHCGGAFIATEGGKDTFDGLAHVARFRLSPASPVACSFTNRFVDSITYRLFKEKGLRLWEFVAAPGVDSAKDWTASMKEIAAHAKVKDNLNVTFWRHGPHVAVASEFPQGVVAVLDENCETIATVKPLGDNPPDPRLPGGFVITTPAHYLDAGGDSDYHAATYFELIPGSLASYMIPTINLGYRIFRGRDQEKYTQVGEMQMTTFKWTARGGVPLQERPSYQHIFCETSQYVIIVGTSVRMDPKMLSEVDFSLGFFGIYNLEAVPIVFHVFAKQADHTVKHVADCHADVGGHIWHIVNMCEQSNGQLLLDLTFHNNWGHGSKAAAEPTEPVDCIMRFTLDLERCQATTEKLTVESAPAEFTCVNPFFFGNPNYRFLYGIHFGEKGSKGRLAKFDLQTREVTSLAVRASDGSPLWATEPQFVPDPSAKNEEESGVLLCFVTDEGMEASFLLVVDPRTMTEIARMRAPMVLNDGLHNRFVPDEARYPIVF